MRFFSKLTFICNLCFVAYVVLRWVDLMGKKAGHTDSVQLLPPLQSTIVVLGILSVFVNLSFNLAYLVGRLRKKQHNLPAWLVWANLIFLLAQLLYFFI